MSIAITIYAIYFIISLAIDILIFNIMYSTINSEISYLKNVMIYTICLQTKLMIIKNYGFRWILFGICFLVALIIIGFLRKITLQNMPDKVSIVSFTVMGVISQAIAVWLIQHIII